MYRRTSAYGILLIIIIIVGSVRCTQVAEPGSPSMGHLVEGESRYCMPLNGILINNTVELASIIIAFLGCEARLIVRQTFPTRKKKASYVATLFEV